MHLATSGADIITHYRSKYMQGWDKLREGKWKLVPV